MRTLEDLDIDLIGIVSFGRMGSARPSARGVPAVGVASFEEYGDDEA
jgi:hypothetical protein